MLFICSKWNVGFSKLSVHVIVRIILCREVSGFCVITLIHASLTFFCILPAARTTWFHDSMYTLSCELFCLCFIFIWFNFSNIVKFRIHYGDKSADTAAFYRHSGRLRVTWFFDDSLMPNISLLLGGHEVWVPQRLVLVRFYSSCFCFANVQWISELHSFRACSLIRVWAVRPWVVPRYVYYLRWKKNKRTRLTRSDWSDPI